MKKLLVVLLFILPTTLLFAQSPCSTQMPPEMMNWLKAYKQAHPNAPALKTSVDSSFVWLPVKVHSVGTNAGGGYYKVSQVLDMFCTLNAQYRPYGWQFYMYGDIDYINNDNLNQHTGNYQNTINSTSVPNVANLFFVDNPSGACGYFTGWGGPRGSDNHYQGFIAINKSCAAADNITVAHELGHFFSLPHTFNGWENRDPATDAAKASDEYVDESNCSTAGDYFCDTKADYQNYRWNCPYSGTKKDFHGDFYQPDGSLYMGYSDDACATRFSDEQFDAMRAYLPSNRPYMTAIQHDSFPDINDTVSIIYPFNNVVGISARYVQLGWHSVKNATAYSVQISRSANASVLTLDTIVTDTTLLLTDLDSNYTYRWRVRAFNPGKTCSPYTLYNFFKTSGVTTMTPSFTIDNVNPCAADTTGDAMINITGGAPPFTYKWSNGANTSFVVGLDAGVYSVTVFGQNFDSTVYYITITAPAPLEATIAYNGSNVFVSASGGTPNYSYQWSNGATSADPGTLPIGSNTVTVSDSKGCTVQKQIDYTGIEALSGINELNVYPNPAANGQAVVVEANSTKSFTGQISLFDNTGRLVQTFAKEIEQGANRFTINPNNLSAGVYIVKLTGSEVSINRKLVIY